ncbi:hypothetical protein [Pseudonocardia sp. NPDC049154]|uniref:hypothetical protein n=1 Tax=Pseudonocardia sp. NPDC049154 TaxID=3155501 RepID=UPI0033CF3CF1
MKPRVGTTLRSATDGTTVVVVRWGADDVEITCGGAPMVDARSGTVEPVGADPAQQDGTQMGKRYVDEGRGIELLCTKAGAGTLAVAGAALPIKGSKPLPASD